MTHMRGTHYDMRMPSTPHTLFKPLLHHCWDHAMHDQGGKRMHAAHKGADDNKHNTQSSTR